VGPGGGMKGPAGNDRTRNGRELDAAADIILSMHAHYTSRHNARPPALHGLGSVVDGVEGAASARGFDWKCRTGKRRSKPINHDVTPGNEWQTEYRVFSATETTIFIDHNCILMAISIEI